MTSDLLTSLRRELKRVANPAKAPQMQAYMKSTMPYHGVPAPQAREVFRNLFADLQFADHRAWSREVLAIWRGAEFREERYAAVHLTGHQNAKPFQTPEAVPLYEELIVGGAWWDYVDDIATHCVSRLLSAHPKQLRPALLSWAAGENMWKRRTAIICQIPCKKLTDLELLDAAIAPSLSSKEFFLRKAIGWALRELTRSNPEWVVDYVAAHQKQLSPLSRREALRRLVASGHTRATNLQASFR